MKLNVIDLFAGCGGLTDGFAQTKKFKTLAAVDWEAPTVNTLRKRMNSKWGYNMNGEVMHFDIQRTDELLQGFDDPEYGTNKGLKKTVGDKNVDVIIGGPPCQAYSIAGRVRDENGMHDDYRNFLFESYVKIVDVFKPKAFVFENVEGILSAKPGGISIIERITKAFEEIGYEIADDLRKKALFDTSFFGVPQKRKRVIIYGVPKSDNSSKLVEAFYEKMHARKSKNPTISGKAFKGLPKLVPAKNKVERKRSHETLKESSELPLNHEPRFHSDRDIKVFKILTEDIVSGTNKYNTTASLIQLYEEMTGKKSNFHKYHVIRTDKPSNTIPAHLYKDGLRHIHPDPEQARSITVREAARLQSFDDDFEFLGSRGDQYKMIGNAVPPGFAKHIAQVVSEVISN